MSEKWDEKWDYKKIFAVHGKSLFSLVCRTLELYTRGADAEERETVRCGWGDWLSEFCQDLKLYLAEEETK